MDITWTQFKEIVTEELDGYHKYIYRGQANTVWPLWTTLHRTGRFDTHETFKMYFETILPFVQQPFETYSGLRFDLRDDSQMAQFLSILQHNGFPTPLLDWTYSPYIAAYFAFDRVDHFRPHSDKIAIYAFKSNEWYLAYSPTYDWNVPEPHVTLLDPTYRDNPKQMLQQSTFLFTNTVDIQAHIEANEKTTGQFLTKYEISVKEKPVIFRELNAMNINAMMLAPSIESVCKKVWDYLCTHMEMGLTPSEFSEYLEKMASRNPPQTDVSGGGDSETPDCPS